MARQGDLRGSYHSQAKRALDELIAKLAGDGVRRLPAEDELGDLLGFSRPTIRSALLSLQKEGKVQRLHGVGSFINRHALAMHANLAEDRAFVSILEGMGYQAGVRNLEVAEVGIDADDLARLELPAPQQGCRISRVFLASDRPAVHSVDLVPAVALTAPVDEVTPGTSTFEFVRTWTERAVRYSVVDIRAVAAGAEIADVLGIDPGSPLILLDHLHVDGADDPVALTRAYVNDAVLRFSMVRAYLDI